MAGFSVFFIIFGLALIQTNVAQLTPDEVPPELKYILELNLGDWQPPKDISDKLIYYLSGFDYDNRPIWIVEFGKWDLRYFIEKEPKWEKQVDKYVDQLLLRFYESTRIKATEDLPVKDGVLIVDFEGFNYHQISSTASLTYFLKKIRTIVGAIPLANDLFVINVNFAAKKLLELLRPILGKEFHRLEIFGTNPRIYRAALVKVLPKDQIPEWYGGDKDFKPLKIYG